MAQNDQQYGYGQAVPPTTLTPAVTMEAASFQNINNIDPALRGDDASSSSLIPSDPKKRSRDDEDGEVLGRPKVPRQIEPKGKEKEVVQNTRKRRGSLLGPEMSSTPSDQSMMSSGQETQSVDLSQTDTSGYPSAPNSSALTNQVVLQPGDHSARPICKPKSKLNSLKAMAVGLPQALEAQWQNNFDPNGPQYPSVQFYNGGEGSSQGSAAYDQGYGYPQPSWNGGQLAYNDEFSDQYGMQQHDYGCAYSGEPSEAFDVFGQRQELDLPGSSAMYSWGEVCSHVAAKEEEVTAAKDQQIFLLQQTAATNLSDQRRIDKEEYLGILGQKDNAYNEMEGKFFALEASIPAKLLEREQATRKVGEDLFKDEKQKWSETAAAKDNRIQELENQLNQAINAPRPQPQVIVQADPRVASLQEQLAAYEAADRARAEEEGQSQLNTQKSANDLKEALEIIETLRQEKTALEGSEKEAKSSVGKLTGDNEALTTQLQSSKSEVEKLKKEKNTAGEKVAALETQIQNTPKVHPDTEKELSELVSKVQELEKRVKEVATLRSQLRESKKKVKTLQIEADKVPTPSKELEQRKERVATVSSDASDGVRYRRRLRLPSGVPAALLNSGPVVPRFNEKASATVFETPAKPAWLESLHKDQPRKMICNIALTRENNDLKVANAKLNKDIRTAKEQKTRAEADFSNTTEKLQTREHELTRAQKIKDMLARALILLGIFLLFAILCIPRLVPTPGTGKSTTSPIIRQSPLRTEVLTKIHKLPEVEKTNNLQFEDFYPEYRFDDLETERSIAESIRIGDIYDEYLAVMIEKASQRTFPLPTSSYPETPSPADEYATSGEQEVRKDMPTSPPSPIKSSKQEEKSGFQDWLDGVKECVLGCLIICAFLVAWGIGANVWEFLKWRSDRDDWLAELNEKHRLADIEKAHREGSRYHVFFGDDCQECQSTALARKGLQTFVYCGGA